MKINTAKILWFKISTTSNFERVILTRGSSNEAMAFYRHFQPSDDLPDCSRLLSASLSPVMITGCEKCDVLK